MNRRSTATVALLASLICLGPELALAQVETFGRVGAWPYGPSHCVDADPARNLAFLGSGGVVLILDVTIPGAPVLISEDIHTRGLALDVFYDARTKLLHIACGEGGFEIWDVADPANPVRLSAMEVLYFGYDTPVDNVDVRENHAIVGCEWGYVHSLDVSDPTAPVDVSFNGLMGNPAHDLYISPDGQTHTTGADRYQRLWISPEGALHNSGFKDYVYAPVAVFGNDEVAYVGFGADMHIIDLLYPGWPLWSMTDVGGIIDIVVIDGIAYIINGDGLRVWDVHTHNNPFFLGNLGYSLYHSDRLAVYGKRAYLTDRADGLHMVDVNDPTQPVELGSYPALSVTWQTALMGNHAIVAHDRDGMFVLDLTDLSRPELVGRLDTPDALRQVDLVDNLAYLADLGGGLRIADLSDPTAPVELGAYEEISAWRVLVEGDLAYVIESNPNLPYRLWILDISDPTMITPVGNMEVPTLVWCLAKSDQYLYLATNDDGVRIIDVSNPSSPTEAGSFYQTSVNTIVVRDGLLYLTAADSFDGGFFIYDLADPTNPTLLGSFEQTGFAGRHLALWGEYAFVSNGERLHLIFVADPATPLELGDYTMPGDLFSLTARDDLIFVSDGVAGLQILENLHHGDPGPVSWEVLSSGTSEDLHGVCFADRDQGWVVGDGGSILHTADGGDTWAPQTSGTGHDLRDICCADESTAWAVGGGGTILKTADGGEAWDLQASGTGADLAAVVFVGSDRGWAVGAEGTILHTGDGGTTWFPQQSGISSLIGDVDFVDPVHGWTTSPGFGEILRTEDGGATWQSHFTGSGAVLLALDFVDPSTGWAVGMFGEIIKTTTGGLNWTQQEGEHPPDWLYDVHFLDDQTGWNVGFTGKIQNTTDGGADWETQPSGCQSELHAVHFVDHQAGWAVGNDGTILRALGSLTGVGPGESTETPARQPNLAVHPNPFNPQTTIRYWIPQAGPVKLEVFDTLGRRVRSLVDAHQDAGSLQIQWNGRDGEGRALPSGIYFARLTTRAGSSSEKMVLVR